ncbi:hypothetical protein CCR85_12755 [Rhodothalassium salexigens]|nr:hypothetical protein [Rhodothalassium salexigens]MBK5921486.1 hypothetical protein [Rhodothalassium salexigens]
MTALTMTALGLILFLGVFPAIGFASARTMSRLLLDDPPPARPSLYLNAMLSQWALVVPLVTLFALTGTDLARLGLHLSGGPAVWAGFAAVAAIHVGLLAVRARAVRSSRLRVWLWRRMHPATRRLLPQTPADLAAFAPVAVTAGVCEEILFRGLPFFLLADLPAGAVLVIPALSFGTLHLYQGVLGFGVTAIAGLAFGGLYLATGSLLPVMLLHGLYNWEVARLHLLLVDTQ